MLVQIDACSSALPTRIRRARLSLPWYNHQHRLLDIATGTALWFHYGLPGVSIRFVLIRDVAGKFEPQALLSTDLALAPQHILACFMRRWQMEPTLQHVRTHLGVETQRQWSDKAIARTTPSLLGLFSFITLLAHPLMLYQRAQPRSAAWYPKPLLTFTDALALVRHQLWAFWTFHLSTDEPDMVKVPRPLLEHFNDLLAYAARMYKVQLSEAHFRPVLKRYLTYYNTRRPHQGLAQQCPVPLALVPR